MNHCGDTAQLDARDGHRNSVAIRLFRRKVCDVDCTPLLNRSSEQSCWIEPAQLTPVVLGVRLRQVMHCDGVRGFTIEGVQNTKARIAQADCLFEHCVEHRGEVAGRGVDDLQDLSGRGLLFQRLVRLGDEPRILHRDYGLCGEVLQQRDLFLGERPDLPATDDKRP